MADKNFNLKFLVAGLFNVIFGYLNSIFFYSEFHVVLGEYPAIFLATVLNISVAFIVHKFCVYKTKGNLVREYFKSYITYGMGLVLSTLLVPEMLRRGMAVESAFLLLIVLSALVSYLGHGMITFRR